MTQKFSLLALFSLLAPFVSAQILHGFLVGLVVDAQSPLIPNAKVRVENLNTGYGVTTETGQSGNYSIRLLPPGLYGIVSGEDGVKRFVNDELTVTVSQTTSVNNRLEVTKGIEVVGRVRCCRHGAFGTAKALT